MTPRPRRFPMAVWPAALLLGCALGTGPTPRGGDAGPPRVDSAVPRVDSGLPRLDSGSAGVDAGRDAGPPPPVDAGPPDAGCATEVCSGADEDCDGQIDEGGVCPCEVRYFFGHAYQFCTARRSWAAARMACELDGYSLTVIEDSAEDAFVYGEMSGRGFASSWIGLNDILNEGVFVWLDGVPLVYEHWDGGEPNDGGGGEDCAVIMTESGRLSQWDDRPCSGERPYVCEAPPP